MKNYFIAIGGTGQMVALAYLRLAKLCGFKPAEIYLMDCDKAGPLTQQLQKVLGKDSIPTIRPIPEDETVETFRSLFKDSTNYTMNDVLSVLFTEEQLQTHIKTGMYGQPPIGAATLMEKIRKARPGSQPVTGPKEDIQDKELRDLINSIGQAGEERVVIVGSLMGGTGAGGVPTLAHYLKDNIQGQPHITIIDFLKWFHIPSNPTWDATLEKNANSGIFFLKDKIANDVDACVLLGVDQKHKIEYRDVGKQEEISHFINLLAAVIATKAFHTPGGRQVFPEPHRVYAYAMPENGFNPSKKEDDLPVILPNGRSITLSEMMRMERAVAMFLEKFAAYLKGGPSFGGFVGEWVALPKKLRKSFNLLAKTNAKNREDIWNDMHQAILEKREAVMQWIKWFDGLFLDNCFLYQPANTTITDDDYKRAQEAEIPMDFLRYWVEQIDLKNWEPNIQTENVDGFAKETVLALKRTIHTKYLGNTWGDLKWLVS